MKLVNFKCHEETPEIEFAPITLLVGPNSSGKTALLDPLLILKQTLAPATSSVGPIVLNGSYVSLGGFSDVVYNHEPSRTLGITIQLRLPVKNLRVPSAIKERIMKEVNLNEIKVNYSVQIAFSEKQQRMFLSKLQIFSEIFKFDYDPIEKTLKTEIFGFKRKPKEIPTERNLRDLTSMIPIWTRSSLLQKRKETSEMDSWQIYLLTRKIIESMVASIEGLEYIGPMRESPSRYYYASGEKVSDVGISGEDFFQVLHQDMVLGGDLMEQLDKWLKILGVAEGAELKPIDPNLFSLEILSPYTKTHVNIIGTGFGVSQIVPVIVQSHLMSRNSTLVLEQPEIHLHPKAQATLADLLIELANKGRMFIVETHSEHIVLRLQRRVAEKKIKSDEVKIYYFDPSETGVTIRSIEIDSKGQLLDFPQGFMEEGLNEAYRIALASSSE